MHFPSTAFKHLDDKSVEMNKRHNYTTISQQINTNKFHIDDFFLPPMAPECWRDALIISAQRTLSCSSSNRSLYWLRSSSTRAISTRVNRFLCATALSSYSHVFSN